MDRFLTERRFVALTFLVFAAITLFVTLHHEAWRDEVDVWVVARDGGLGEIWRGASSRGTPVLWYVLVWPFAAVGFPYLAQQLLNLAIVWAAVFLFLRFAPFPRATRALFALSYYPAFEYSAIARPYGLLMLLLFLLAHQWQTREERPIRLAVTVALLANTSVHGLIMAAVAGALLLSENVRMRRLRAMPILIMLAGGLASVMQLWPSGDHVYTYVTVETVWFSLAAAFFPGMRQTNGLLLAIPAFLILGYAVSRRIVPLVFLLGSLVPLILLYVYVWMGGFRHAGIVTILAIAAVWMARAYGPLRVERLTTTVLAVAFAWSIVPAWTAWTSETRWAYSGSRDAAAFLETVPADTELVCCTPLPMAALAYLPDRRFWYAGIGGHVTYVKWGDEFWPQNVSIETCVARARRQFSGQKWLLVTHSELPPALAKGFRLRHHSDRRIWVQFDEDSWVYEPLPSP